MQLLRILMVGFVVGWLATAAAQAQPPENWLLKQATQSHWIQFDIVGGRLVLEGSRTGYQSSVSNGSRGKEQLSVHSDNGCPKMTYERSTPNERLFIEIRGSERVQISHTPLGTSTFTPMEFVQARYEATTMTLGPAGHQQTYRTADLWRLCITRPAECKQHLFPWLELLKPELHLAETIAKVEHELLTSAGKIVVAEHAHWMKLVEQLGDDRFAKREEADRALRSVDPAVLGCLQRLDFGRLDAEQQFRVRRIIETSASQIDDGSPEHVAMSLAGDPAVWLALLARPELATRQTAARPLAVLLGEPVLVDPNADPATQQARLQQLQMRIDGK